MESNHVGVIIVQDKRHVTGIVTDRDLAVRAIGYELDPKQTPLSEIMTTDVATLPITATEAEAVELMQRRHVRRIPSWRTTAWWGSSPWTIWSSKGERRSRTSPRSFALSSPNRPRSSLAARCIRWSRCTGPRSLSRDGASRPRNESAHRHAARAEETFGRLVHRVQTMAGLDNREFAVTALELVLGGVIRRITPQEASDLVAQLPSTLQDRMLDLPAGPDRSITRDSIEQELVERLDLLGRARCPPGRRRGGGPGAGGQRRGDRGRRGSAAEGHADDLPRDPLSLGGVAAAPSSHEQQAQHRGQGERPGRARAARGYATAASRRSWSLRWTSSMPNAGPPSEVPPARPPAASPGTCRSHLRPAGSARRRRGPNRWRRSTSSSAASIFSVLSTRRTMVPLGESSSMRPAKGMLSPNDGHAPLGSMAMLRPSGSVMPVCQRR